VVVVALGQTGGVASLASFRVNDRVIELREAVADDVLAIVQLLADDPLGSTREQVDPAHLEPYLDALATITADPAHLLLVAVDESGVVATMQFSVLPGLARRGAPRAQIEAVRVRADHRGQGLGETMLRWAIAEAEHRGCALVQLTSDKSRAHAHRFYERLGFSPSHEGFKLNF
jgi:GNAT superfamily N-acetyltransferase